VSADTGILSQTALDELAGAFERHTSLDDIISIARHAQPLQTTAASDCTDSNRTGFCTPAEHVERMATGDTASPPSNPTASPFTKGGQGGVEAGKGIAIGVARDAAFHFYYQDFFDALEMRGCRLHYFSPLADSRLPDDLDALYIGGGYPEEHAERLSENRAMLKAIQKFSQSSRPVYGECGGLMYLCRKLEKQNGTQCTMVGLIPAATRMLARLKSLGYVEVTLNANSLWGASGAVLRGHEFHYSELTSDPTKESDWNTVYALKRHRTDDAAREGFQKGRVLASYVHMHLASRPEALKYFIELCESQR